MITLQATNGREIRITQGSTGGALTVTTTSPEGKILAEIQISPEDAVTMLNWYSYQKETGNRSLNY